MLEGYNIFFVPKDPEGLSNDEIYFLYLSYPTFQEAKKAQKILEQVYGSGNIDIEYKCIEASLTE